MTIESPELDAEAMRQADVGLADRIANQPPRRTRGRPPGSKNKATIEREQTTVSHLSIPRTGGNRAIPSPSLSDEETERVAQKKRADKKKLADEYAAKIVIDLNEQMFTLLIGVMGVPADLLYRPGHAPQFTKVSDKYTDVGNALAVNPNQAKAIGTFLADLASTDSGSKVAHITDNQTAALVIHGAVALFAGVQYIQGLQAILKQLQPVIEAHNRRKAQADQEAMARQNGQGNE